MSDTLKNMYAYVADMPGSMESKLELIAKTLAGYLKLAEVHLTLSTEDKEFTGTTSTTLRTIKKVYSQEPITAQHAPSTSGAVDKQSYLLMAEGFSTEPIPAETKAILQLHVMMAAEFLARKKTEKESERVKAQLAIMRQKVVHDPLITELLNKQGLEEVLIAEIERSKRTNKSLGLIYADIDHFKHVNDHQGHLAGDQVLLQIGTVLKTKSRPYDHVARIGGEEFAILLPETQLENAKDIALRINLAVANENYRIILPDKQFTIKQTISVGVTAVRQFKEDTNTLATNLKYLADKLLYMAKEAGRNRVYPQQYQSPHTT